MKRFSDEQIVTISREVDTQGKSIEDTCKRHKVFGADLLPLAQAFRVVAGE
jgi:hypothetical protein